jgi:hypothetical protein
MKIAILLPGQPRFTGDFDTFLKNLSGYTQADWFVYMTNEHVDRQAFVDRKGINLLESWINFDKQWAIDKLQSNLPANNYVRSFEISDCYTKQWPSVTNLFEVEQDWIHNVFMMHYNLNQCNQLRLNSGIDYDMVIRIRTDVGITEPLDITEFSSSKNTVFISDNERHGLHPYRCNDLMSIGDPDSMNAYCDLVNWLKIHNNNGVPFHPETMMGFHLANNHIEIKNGNFLVTLRKIPIDTTRWY